MTIWRMRITCWIFKATNTLSEYVTLNAFPLQQWLNERVSVLLYTYIAVLFKIVSVLPDQFPLNYKLKGAPDVGGFISTPPKYIYCT